MNSSQNKNHNDNNSNHKSIAIFIDFENLALGYKGQGRFEIKPVLKRILEKGKVVAKKAYCDWSRFGQYTVSLHEAAIELIEIPKRGQSGKNSADIRLCVDAMDLAYSKDHIDTFVIVSGDSDFSPLVSKLKELGKHVIGLGMSESTSSLLRDNCDEFIYYEDLIETAPAAAPVLKGDNVEKRQKAFAHLFEGLQALRRENREVLGSSLLKDTVKRMHPGFNEIHLGFRNWGSLLVDAQREGLLELTTDPRSGTFVIVRFGDEMKSAPAPISYSTQTTSVPSPVVHAAVTTTPAVAPTAIAAPTAPTPKPSGRTHRLPVVTRAAPVELKPAAQVEEKVEAAEDAPAKTPTRRRRPPARKPAAKKA